MADQSSLMPLDGFRRTLCSFSFDSIVTTIAKAPDAALVRRGLRLNYLSLGYSALEAVASIAAGVVAGSVSLTGFGIDSVVEVSASLGAQWRLRSPTELAERYTRQIVGVSFLALAAWVLYEAI